MKQILEDLKKFIWKNRIVIYDFIKNYFQKNKKTEIKETKNFKKSEIAVSSSYPNLAIFPTDPKIVDNVNRSLENMEKIRVIVGNIPLKINSFYRSKELNNAVKGATNSNHVKGLAVDFTANTDLKKLYNKLVNLKLEYVDELIFYKDKNFIHISFKR